MPFKYKSYAGKILKVDLSLGTKRVQELDEGFARTYLGGAGFCSRMLYDAIEPRIDPLSPANVLMFATGPLTGTLFPQASRYIVAAKSPLTGIWGESHAAGHWAPELKFSGFDAIVLEGRSPKPVYLWVNDREVEIKDARQIWGKTTYEADELIKEELGDKEIKVATIGQAGENLVRFACIINECSRVAARSGMGTVMGSKNLKAIAVRGFKGLEIADAEHYLDFIHEMHQKMLENPFTESRVKYGTTNLVEMMNQIGRLPTYNMKQGVFEEFEKISGETLRQKYFVRPRADFACLQRCGRFVRVPSGRFACEGKGPEFECLSALGSRCGNSNLESVIYAHHLCNLYGMDTISAGSTISWAMECYENGVITKEDTGGLDLSWGNYESVVKLIEMMAKREGLGKVLGEGSWKAAEKIGKGSDRYVMCVKKQEIAGQEPRAQKSMGLASAVSARGADHLYAFPVLDEVGFGKEIEERLGKEYLPEIADRLNPRYKGIMVKKCEDFCRMIECVGVCLYGTEIPPVYYYGDIARALELSTGMKLNEKDLQMTGERVVNLNRAFNAREGITRRDDTLPSRLTTVPAPKGPPKGQVVELDQMLDEYYSLRGWDKETGLPRREKLEEIGLKDIADNSDRLIDR